MCLRRYVAAALFALSVSANAQTPGGFVPGTTLPAASLNNTFGNKQDYPVLTQPLGTKNTTAASTAFVLQEEAFIAIKDYPCAGNGTSDDSSCVQSAVTDAITTGKPLFITGGPYRVNTAPTISGQLILIGNGGGQGQYNTTCLSGLRIGAAAVNLLTLSSAGSRVSNLCIDVVGGVTHTGTVITSPANAHSVTVEKSQINSGCVSIAVTGSGSTQNKGADIRGNVITPVSGTGCIGIAIGQSSTGANTGDGYYHENTIYCATPGSSSAIGMALFDSGGDAITNNNIYGCSVGTQIKPGANQQVLFADFISTILGDFSENNDLLIDSGASTASITSLFFIQTWTSGDGNAEAGPNVLIQNTNNIGNFQGIHFVGHRSYSYTAANDNFKVSGSNVKFVEILDSHICSAVTGSGSAAGIHVTSAPAYTQIKNNVIGGCDVGGSFPNGVLVDSSSNLYTITNNDISTGTTSFALNLAGTSGTTTAIVNNNLGVDNVIAGIASAATIQLFANPINSITGTTAVTTINGMFGTRVIYMTTPSGVAFNTGGNLCNAVTSAANNTVIGYWGGACWFLK